MAAPHHMPHAKLPDQATLLSLYLKDDLSFAEIGERYGVAPKTVWSTMRRRQIRAAGQWPLKSRRPNNYVRVGMKQRKRLDSITAEMVKHEINHAVATLPTQKKIIAELSGVSAFSVGRIANGHYERITRTTAERIMRAIEKLERQKKSGARHGA